jgi:hypothetical protein
MLVSALLLSDACWAMADTAKHISAARNNAASFFMIVILSAKGKSGYFSFANEATASRSSADAGFFTVFFTRMSVGRTFFP